MHSSGSTLAGMNPALLSIQTQMRGSHETSHHTGTLHPNMSLHPAFQLQGYPFYPGGLLAAIRPQGQVQNTTVCRDTGSKSPGSTKSFTIDAILADHKEEDHSSRESSPRTEDTSLRIPDVSRLQVAGSGRIGLVHPFSAHAHGLPHYPAALRYGQFQPGGRADKKQTHMNGSGWKGKSKRVRTIFTPEQLERLEAEFERQQYMVGTERYYLAASLNLTEAQVKVWFQNRRIKWRKQNLEQQHAKMANYELFEPEEESDSENENAERKFEDNPANDIITMEEDVTSEESHKNSSFDSGISVDRSNQQCTARELLPIQLAYINRTVSPPSCLSTGNSSS